MVQTKPAVECRVPTDGVVALRPLAVHASSRSTSALPRRVLHFEYAASVALGSGIELAVAYPSLTPEAIQAALAYAADLAEERVLPLPA